MDEITRNLLKAISWVSIDTESTGSVFRKNIRNSNEIALLVHKKGEIGMLLDVPNSTEYR